MARNKSIDATMALPGIPARRGRPSTGKAKTGAQRQKDYRARLRAAYKESREYPEFPSRVTKNP